MFKQHVRIRQGFREIGEVQAKVQEVQLWTNAKNSLRLPEILRRFMSRQHASLSEFAKVSKILRRFMSTQHASPPEFAKASRNLEKMYVNTACLVARIRKGFQNI